MNHLTRICAGFTAVGACCSALAQQPPGWQFDRDVNRDALPGVPAGFEVSFFAREPLVRQPCSMAFDSQGRLCVGMGPQYRKPNPNTPGDSVVLVLDTDGDGKAGRTKVFATGFNAIQGLAWHGRDLWVANAPDLTVVRDLDGDDEADEYVRVFTDLGNLEHGLHGLNWAPAELRATNEWAWHDLGTAVRAPEGALTVWSLNGRSSRWLWKPPTPSNVKPSNS